MIRVIRRYFEGLSRFEAAFVVAVVCLAAVGIGRAFWPSPDGATPRPTATVKKLPVVIGSPEPTLIDSQGERSDMGLPPPPASDASLTEKVLDEIREKALVMAGIPAQVGTRCEGGGVTVKKGEWTPCTATYRGVELVWEVFIEDVTGGGAGIVQLIDYQLFPPDSGVLLAKTVHGRFWAQHHEDAKELRCDRMPHLKKVALGKDTGYRCQYLDATGDTPRWVNKKVFLEEVGPVFRETW
ncbi:hypothetical protein GKQ77_10030 [Streptomyces sp. BG9H]|uniref:Uncharacterized protein n=1 Tax=Streptomyces anatolicus TaxID=2675858 RepID=A0ABS6YMT8_9ACTN|nr:hypothetical protein [Streptomyces anatolicus]MBW5421902.1 hypothetical protein [Streptomyces anatolicus]